jgi:hypothetical protein
MWQCIPLFHKLAQRIIVHYDRADEGDQWEIATSIPGIEWRKADFSTTINGHPVTDQRIICDMYRLNTLNAEGGFFCDLDFVFLKSFETIRHHEAVIGTQCKAKQKLCCALMGCVPGSAFIRAYIDAYTEWTPAEQKTFWNYANSVPWELAKTQPVHVLPRTTLYPLCWSNKTFFRGETINIKNSLCMHLWETLNPTLTVADLQKTILRPVIEELTGQPAQTPVLILPGRLLSFQ